jgi:LacI family transcriptional regulator
VLANDALAFGFMRVALQRGVRMPHDLSIVGFDGLPHGALFCPALTTVSQPMREMGRVACCRLFEAIEDPGRIESTEFPMVLIERESTGPAPAVRSAALHLVTP